MTRSISSYALAAVASLALAACSDAPTAPAVSAIPSADAQAAKRIADPLAMLYLSTHTTEGVVAPSSTVAFTSFTGRYSTVKTVQDNGPDDLDPRVGYFKITIAKSQKYEARVVAGLSLYYKVDAVKQVTSSGIAVDMGTIVMKLNPKISIKQVKAGSFTAIAGGSFMVNAGMLVEDNGMSDMDPVWGTTTFPVQGTGTYTVCEETAPTRMAPLQPKCFSVTTGTWGTTKVHTIIR